MHYECKEGVTILEYSGTLFKQSHYDSEEYQQWKFIPGTQKEEVMGDIVPGDGLQLSHEDLDGVYMKLVGVYTGGCTWNNEQKIYIHQTEKL